MVDKQFIVDIHAATFVRLTCCQIQLPNITPLLEINPLASLWAGCFPKNAKMPSAANEPQSETKQPILSPFQGYING